MSDGMLELWLRLLALHLPEPTDSGEHQASLREQATVMNIRAALSSDRDALLNIWLRSVRATHVFLTESDIQSMLPLVRDVALAELELWVLCAEGGKAIGFLGLSGAKLEALFLAPEQRRRGGGRLLVEFARQLKGPLTVDVNEQNPEAVAFYLALGFRVVGRSATDSDGRPFPLLHLSETVAQQSDAVGQPRD